MIKKHTETVDSKLKTTWQIVSRMYNTEAALHGVTIAMGHFLLNIDSQDGAFASDIAPQLGMESTSLSRLILSLEQKQLILRIPDESDRRRIKIVLTAKGKSAKEQAKNVVRNFNRLVELKIGKKKLEEFYKTIDRIADIAEEQNKLIKQENF